jgi:MFS family permease
VTAAVQAQDSAAAVLRNRKFLSLWIAQVVTQVGGNMVLFGLTVEVFALTKQSTSVSLIILSFLVPTVIFGAIAGVYVDRLDRRLILVSTNIARGLLFLLLLVVPQDVLVICLITALISTISTFFAPAEIAMIPVVVSRRQLLPANSLHVITLQAAFFLGFALLGPLVIKISNQQVLLVLVAASYFVGALLCFTLPRYNPRVAGSSHNPTEAIGEAGGAVRETFVQLADGVRFILRNRSVFWPLAYLATTSSLIGVLGVLGPGFATQVLGLAETDFVVVVLPLGVGLIFGILVLNVYGKHFTQRRGIESGLVALGITLLALSLVQPIMARVQLAVSLLAIVIAVAFAAGIAYAFVAVPAQTQLQEELPAAVRGRVFGVLNMLVSIASFLPIIIVGPIADALGTSWVVFGSAIIVLVVAAGSIILARPAVDAAVSGKLVDALDPVALTGRSLTAPIPLQYMDSGNGDGAVTLLSPVVPGEPGPAESETDPDS